LSFLSYRKKKKKRLRGVDPALGVGGTKKAEMGRKGKKSSFY